MGFGRNLLTRALMHVCTYGTTIDLLRFERRAVLEITADVIDKVYNDT